jgi:hypothetical protein
MAPLIIYITDCLAWFLGGQRPPGGADPFGNVLRVMYNWNYLEAWLTDHHNEPAGARFMIKEIRP